MSLPYVADNVSASSSSSSALFIRMNIHVHEKMQHRNVRHNPSHPIPAQRVCELPRISDFGLASRFVVPTLLAGATSASVSSKDVMALYKCCIIIIIISARCNIYISRLCYDVSVRLSVRLSVTEVHWCIIANLGFKFRYKFTTHCGRGEG